MRLSCTILTNQALAKSPYLPYGWSPIGQPVRRDVYSRSKRLNVLGFMSRQQKLIYHTTEERVDTGKVVEAFDKLAEHKDPDRQAVVILDNAMVHRSKKFRRHKLRWLEQGLSVVYLPTYCPELNLIEILWRKVKYHWMPVDTHRTFEGLKACVNEVLSNFGQEYKICFS